jgi:hypothetical protein
MDTLRKIIGSFHISSNTNPRLNTEPAIHICWSPYIHVMIQKKWALGRIRVRCRSLRHKVNKSKYKTNPFYDWLFQIIYICHCVDNQTLIQMSCFPNDIIHHIQHTFLMNREFIKAKRLVGAGLYQCYCITNVSSELQLPLDSWIIETSTKLLCSKFRSIYISTQWTLAANFCHISSLFLV